MELLEKKLKQQIKIENSDLNWKKKPKIEHKDNFIEKKNQKNICK